MYYRPDLRTTGSTCSFGNMATKQHQKSSPTSTQPRTLAVTLALTLISLTSALVRLWYSWCSYTSITLFGYAGEAKAEELRNNKSCIAHLIHGSSEGRFKITYCPGDIVPTFHKPNPKLTNPNPNDNVGFSLPGHLTKEETEGAGFSYGDLI